jgi:predicted metal-dependent enzyme (double-stranded beta helix superfamily)
MGYGARGFAVGDCRWPGYAEVRRKEDRVLGPGDVLTMQPDSIHSVINETSSVTISFHVYGKHVNHTERSQVDPEQHIEKGFIVEIA